MILNEYMFYVTSSLIAPGIFRSDIAVILECAPLAPLSSPVRSRVRKALQRGINKLGRQSPALFSRY